MQLEGKGWEAEDSVRNITKALYLCFLVFSFPPFLKAGRGGHEGYSPKQGLERKTKNNIETVLPHRMPMVCACARACARSHTCRVYVLMYIWVCTCDRELNFYLVEMEFLCCFPTVHTRLAGQ